MMTGDELGAKLNYTGMERAVRRLALEDELASAEEIAVLSLKEVCGLVAKGYEMLYAESEEIGLVRREDLPEVNKRIRRISR